MCFSIWAYPPIFEAARLYEEPTGGKPFWTISLKLETKHKARDYKTLQKGWVGCRGSFYPSPSHISFLHSSLCWEHELMGYCTVPSKCFTRHLNEHVPTQGLSRSLATIFHLHLFIEDVWEVVAAGWRSHHNISNTSTVGYSQPEELLLKEVASQKMELVGRIELQGK